MSNNHLDNLVDSAAESLVSIILIIPAEIATGFYNLFCGQETFISKRQEDPDQNRQHYTESQDNYPYRIRGPPS